MSVAAQTPNLPPKLPRTSQTFLRQIVRQWTLISAIACATMIFASCKDDRKAANNVVAKVGTQTIDIEDYQRKINDYGAALKGAPIDPKVQDKILNDLIEQEILLAEARRRNLLITQSELEAELQTIAYDYPEQEFKKILTKRRMTLQDWKNAVSRTLLVKKAFQLITSQPKPITDAMVQSYYEKHKDEFTNEEQVRALHILLESEQEAFEVLALLKKGQSFEKLAKERSKGPEAQNDGDLGYFSSGVMPKIFDETIFALKKGKVSKVVSSEYGYHIFKLVDRRDSRTVPLSECQDSIRRTLEKQAKEEQYATWLKTQLETTKIYKNKELLAQI